MHVLHIYKDYYPVLGGIESHLKVLATEQARRGLKVTVLVTHPGNGADDRMVDGVRLIRTRRLTTKSSTPISPGLFWHVARIKADVTHLHFPYPPGEMANLLFGRSSKTVITYHSDIIRQRTLLRLYRPFLWQVLRRADHIIATTPQLIASSPYLTHFRDKCVIIPFGVPLERLAQADPVEVAKLRRQHPGPLLLFVGKLRYYKGLEYLIEAMRDIKATLLVVGSGPMGEVWQRLATSLPWGHRVVFCGEVADELLPIYYHACDVFVLPSSERSEAYGLVQVEAMAAGKPVVCTEVGTGTSWVNRDGETGFVVPPRDPAALASAINRLLVDADLRQRFGQAGRTRAFSEFALERMVDRVIGLYSN